MEVVSRLIPKLRAMKRMEPLDKGFSTDKKYLIELKDGTTYLLRTASLDQLNRKKEEFGVLQTLQQYEVRTSEPIEVGAWGELGLCYCLLSYIEGYEASERLPHYLDKEQYLIGVEAGRELKKMHCYEAPQTADSWYPRVIEKHKRYVAAYQTIGIHIPRADDVVRFVEENEAWLTNRPNRFQHDDFHLGNIIVKDRKYAGMIDVNRFDWGDPLHDFYKLALFSREVSVPFCLGQLNGYFGEEGIPENFWRLYSVYVAMSIFSAVVWSYRFTPELVDEMLGRVKQILEDHQYFEEVIPRWYCESDHLSYI
ncbi:aminoglycoside phosphotransferase family protein [Brevibacillus ginsengisoli]|uniref:aminoglycoside phosphotransferase family protein n=1 Tax=Brevibacillus ginsengisoli TaxID=363854 RepID=UPI003CE6B43B